MINTRLMSVLTVGLVLAASAARADSYYVPYGHRDHRAQRVDDRRGDRDYDERGRGHGRNWRPPIHQGRGPVVVVPAHRMRHYRNVIVVRPHGHWYPGYGHFRTDAEAYKWLSFTAITLGVLDLLNESQERALEAAQVRATSAPIGQTIVWNDGSASGGVTAVREGTSTTGRYCREFQQKVIIGGRTEEAYGTACQQADGSWEVVSTNN